VGTQDRPSGILRILVDNPKKMKNDAPTDCPGYNIPLRFWEKPVQAG